MRHCTDKQVQFIARLVASRALDPRLTVMVDEARTAVMAGRFSSADASCVIDNLLDAPEKPVSRPVADEPEAGVYRDAAGRLLRVYRGQQSGRMLAKEVCVGEEYDVGYRYVGTAAGLVCEQQRLSLEEVGKMGIATGECIVCGRRLDDPESVDRGIGPVCAANYNHRTAVQFVAHLSA